MLQCGAKNVNPLERFVSSLPVAAVLSELLTALDCAPQVLLSAPTGAGKSTWLPLQLLAHPGINGKIILLEPRRLAARNVAQRLAELLNEKQAIRSLYGCVRKLRRADTRLEVITEGVLTRVIQRDPELSGVGLVILDEFHERSLQADLALALLLDVQQGLRDDLTPDYVGYAGQRPACSKCCQKRPSSSREGRSFPVERRYLPLPAHQRFDEAVAVATAEMLVRKVNHAAIFTWRRRNSASAGTN
ncbi:DEAD/DEAH box helicase [Shigella sonnei]